MKEILMLFSKIVKNRLKLSALERWGISWFGAVVFFAQVCFAEPQRVVTLAPSLGELAADLVGSKLERIVGVSEFTDYPPVLKKKESVGSYAHFSIEKVVSLRPDLVLATRDGNSQEQVEHLSELGLKVVTVNTGDFRDIEKSIRDIARALGDENAGDQMARRFRTGVEKFRKEGEKKAKVRVLLQVGDNPLVVAGGGSFLNDGLSVLGATNVYGDSKTHYPHPSIEDVVGRNPEVIIVLTMDENQKTTNQIQTRWFQFPEIAAVKNKRVHFLRTDALLRPTLRLLEGLSILDRAIYGRK